MDRSEIYPLVLISLFLVFYASLASSVIAIGTPETLIGQPNLPNYTPVENTIAYQIKSAPLDESQVGQYYYNYSDEQGDLVPWTYDVTGYNDVTASINDYGDVFRLYLSKQDEGAWFPWDKSEFEIKSSELYKKIPSPTSIQLVLNINLQKTFNLVIVSYEGETLIESFNNKHFSVILSEDISTVADEEVSAFNAFIDLVTFNIPDMPEAISFLIASPIYILGTYLIIRIVIMFIPWVSGGA